MAGHAGEQQKRTHGPCTMGESDATPRSTIVGSGRGHGGVDDAPTAVKRASAQARRLGEREVDEIPLTVVAW